MWQCRSSVNLVGREAYLVWRHVFLFIAKHLWGWCFFTEWCILWTLEALNPLFCAICEIVMGVYCPRIPKSCFSPFGKGNIFLTNQPSPERRVCLEWVTSFWSLLQTASAHTAFGSVAVPSALLEERPRWEKDKACFSLKTTIGAGHFHWVDLTLQVGIFKPLVLFVKLLWGNYHHNITMCCFAPFGKRATFPSK